MSKLPTIELKEFEIKEVNGEFERSLVKTEKHPLFFSNYSLKVGKQTGILEKGLEQELFGFLSVLDIDTIAKVTTGNEMNPTDIIPLMNLISLEHMKDVIWLAYVGAKSGKDSYSNEDFKDFYDEDFMSVIEVYMNLLTSSLDTKNQKNAFTEGLNKSLGSQKGLKK